jgi:hypothetical protein
MTDQSAVLVAWVGSLLVVVLLGIGITRMAGTHRAGRTWGSRRFRRWLLVPTAILVGVYATQYGMTSAWRAYGWPVVLVVVSGLVGYLVSTDGDRPES